MIKKEKILIGSDHGGFELKEEIIKHLKNLSIDVEDKGCYTVESCDYPEIGKAVVKDVILGKGRGILICGTGIGMSMVANRNSEIRAALCHNEYTAKMSRMHNDSNVLVLGARALGLGVALEIVEVWLKIDFEGGRHQRRLDMLHKIN